MPEDVLIMIVIMGTLAASSTVWALVHFKIKKKELEMRGSDAELRPEVDALHDDFEQMAEAQEHTRAQLADMQERLDLTERMLAARRAAQENRRE